MIKNFLVSAIRNLNRYRLYSFINIGGLALGLAACLLILLFVRSELGYDSWIPKAKQVFRLHTTVHIHGRDTLSSVRSSGPMAAAFKNTFPEIEASTRMFYSGPRVFHQGNVFQQSLTLVDEDFFKVFDLPLLQGERDLALQDFNSIIISESTAQRYFADEDAIGQTLTLCCYGPDSESIDYRVTGVMADTPANTHFYHDAIALIDENRYAEEPWLFESWTSMNNSTYFRFADGESAADINDRLEWFLDHVMPGLEHGDGDMPSNSELIDLSLMPIEDIHLKARQQASDTGDIRPLGNMTLVVSFLLIAVLILGIATINFLNLTTARYIGRAKEVSMRKVLGASRKEVAVQFLGETIVTSLIALFLSLFLVAVALPWFNEFLSTELEMTLLGGSGNLLILVFIALVTGVVGGIYPSFYVARLNPASVFGSATATDRGRPGFLKTTLIVFQFSISIALMTATAVTWLQTDYARSVDLGYERENRIVLTGLNRSGAREMQDSLLARLREIHGIEAMARSSEVPSESNENNTGFTVQGREQEAGMQIINYISVDYEFFDVYGINPIAGRLFDEQFGSDPLDSQGPDATISGSVVVNEGVTRRLGYEKPEDIVGEVLQTDTFGQPAALTVIGVVPDINNRSARYESVAGLYWMRQSQYANLTLLVNTDDQPGLLTEIEDTWRGLMTTVPFSYSILDDMVRRLYLDEERQVVTFSAFALLAIFISGLGLYGMASITVVKRTREIGLRKVMGAKVLQIIQLLLWQFSKPVVIANIIAWPLAWYFLNSWLDGFVYRIELSPVYFVLAGLSALLIAWLTVVGHAWRVAKSNPIHALSYE